MDISSTKAHCNNLIQPFFDYHHSFKTNFHPLPSDGKVKELALRIGKVIAAPFIYAALGVQAIVGKLLLEGAKLILSTSRPSAAEVRRQEVIRQIEQLKAQMVQIKAQNSVGWQEEATKLLHANRYSRPEEELLRLRAMGSLTPHREANLDHSLQHVAQIKYNPHLQTTRKHAKILMAQAMEIKDLYRDTHDVFIHAQEAKWTTLSYVVKEAIKKYHPEINFKNFKYLRAPSSELPESFLSSVVSYLSSWLNYFMSLPPKEPDVREYLLSKLTINDDDMKTREEILSVDGYFLNYSSYESSLFFLLNNVNILNNIDIIKKLVRQVIEHFCPELPPERTHPLAERVSHAVYQSAPCANLYVACIPKVGSENIQYRAHPYGPRCNCHPEHQDRAILDKLQDEKLPAETKCTGQITAVPQYRLYTPTLKPAKGIRMFLLTPFDKEQRRAVKGPIKNVIAELPSKNGSVVT